MPEPIDWELVLAGEDDETGVVEVPDGELDDYDEVCVSLDNLKQMVRLAESLDWEKVIVERKDNQPVFLHVDEKEVSAHLAITPYIMQD